MRTVVLTANDHEWWRVNLESKRLLIVDSADQYMPESWIAGFMKPHSNRLASLTLEEFRAKPEKSEGLTLIIADKTGWKQATNPVWRVKRSRK